MDGGGETTPFDVGGLELERPFALRRLGHFGLNADRMEETLAFYVDALGLRISDVIDWRDMTPDPSVLEGLGDTRGYFLRYGSDHHAFVLFNRRIRVATDKDGRFPPGVTVNQVTWQVSSLEEVVAASEHLRGLGVRMSRTGRDTPGSNWHTYFMDPDGHTNEIYYGIEQIGWSGRSKPKTMYDRGFREAPPLPQPPEAEEVSDAVRRGVDIDAGYGRAETPEGGRFVVGGVLLPRPFAVTGIGPARLFVSDVARARAFYESTLGLKASLHTQVLGCEAVFLRAGAEHHALALYDLRLRERLPVRSDTSTLSFGLQVANFRQLRDAAAHLAGLGYARVELPPELSPGCRHCVYVADPDGHLVQLYFEMEQVGWDGRTREPPLLPDMRPETWPESVAALPDDGLGQTFLGPWL